MDNNLKQMQDTFKTHHHYDVIQLLIGIVFVVIVGIFLSLPAKADDFIIDSTLELASIPDDEYSDYIIWSNPNGIIMCNKTTSDAVVSFNKSVNGYHLDVGQGYYYKSDTKTWVAYSGLAIMQISTLHYTSRVFYDKSGVSVFSLSPSHPMAHVVGIQKMILPTILSSIKLLIPLLLVLIVSWIGLRKCWNFLKQVLQTS